jgi:hypothetical protein
VFTSHGPDHFDEVVKYAGLLLGCERGDEIIGLSAYELYVLLLAIRLHDAGNVYGREGHEKKAFQILRTMGELSGPDDVEKKFVADIAEAHGGVTADGSKNTVGRLGELESIGSIEVRPRLLAAIVRFADEISESRPRAAGYLLKEGALPKHNEVFHKYASCIKSVNVKPAERTVSLKYVFSAEDAKRKWGKGKDENQVTDVFLIDEIFERLDKMFLERRYCVRFMRSICNVERIRADIKIHDEDHSTVFEFAVDEEEGYPTSALTLSHKYTSFTGEAIYEKLAALQPEPKKT